tara:strand:+ start:132 stop:1595 length:1464 start_codon:yes stop_codon:yes gene_type:complete
MNKETRIRKIEEIIIRDKENPFNKIEIPWEDDLVTMNVYKIPLNLLVYNKYNGRILSRTKSLEKQRHVIDEYSDNGKKLLEQLLWNSKPDRNKKTQKNIADFGQQKIGIITKDGIIIDGNRRAMLLNDIQSEGKLSGKKYDKKYDYFKAVVLPVTLNENPLEIEKLETSFQMGEDQKLSYNATEKYLKAKGLYHRLTEGKEFTPDNIDENAISKIADWMGEQKSEIISYLSTMSVMDEYLYNFGYDGIYTQLDKREDQFLFLTKWLENFYGEISKKAFDGYTDDDVDDLKEIAFDYLRIRNKYDGKEFRNLADGQKENHFFGDQALWASFSGKHEEIRKTIPEETEIDFNSNDLKSHLDARDNKYFEDSILVGEDSAFIENLKDQKTNIEYNRSAGAPEKLVKQASRAFSSIKQNHKAYAKPEVQKVVKELAMQVTTSMLKKSPLSLLQHIESLVKSIELDNVPDSELNEVQKTAKEINKLLYPIYK